MTRPRRRQVEALGNTAHGNNSGSEDLVPKFLNRILGLEIARQQQLFGYFTEVVPWRSSRERGGTVVAPTKYVCATVRK